VVVLVCGLSFAAFLAIRFWGARRGVFLSGILGGLVSSTAVTVSLASQSRASSSGGEPLAVGAGLASTVMLVRIAVLTAIVNPVVLPHLGPFLGAVAAGSILAIAFLMRRTAPGALQDSGLTNPFQLREAIRFGVIFGLVLFLVEAARRYAGSWGIIAASALAGLADVDAITLSLSGMSAHGLPPETAASGIAIAVLANTAAKASYAAWRGSPRFGKDVLTILGAGFAAGAIAIIILGLGPRP